MLLDHKDLEWCQLELFPLPVLSISERKVIAREIRNIYWFVRSARDEARLRRLYRQVSVKKKRLLEGGVSKREVLDLLACCRGSMCRGLGCLDCTATGGKPLSNFT